MLIRAAAGKIMVTFERAIISFKQTSDWIERESEKES